MADGSSERRLQAGQAHPGIALWDSGRRLLADPRIDAVVIATPARTHFELALAALRAGKHVLVEKPLAATSEQAVILIEESARRGLVLMVDHTFLYCPPVRAIRALLDSAELGLPHYYLSARLNRGIVRDDINVLWDVAIHDLSVLDHLVPTAPVAVQATDLSPEGGGVERLAALTLSYETGFLAHLSASWIAPAKVRRVVIGGSERTLVYDDLAAADRVAVWENGVATRRLPLDPVEPLLEVIREFAACIGSGAQPLSGGAMGLRLVRQLEAADISMPNGGRIVELDREGVPA